MNIKEMRDVLKQFEFKEQTKMCGRDPHEIWKLRTMLEFSDGSKHEVQASIYGKYIFHSLTPCKES